MAAIVHPHSDVQPFHTLIVDDDELAILNMQQALSHAGAAATVTAADNGLEALRLLRSGELPAERLLVLTDLNMPGMTGLELLGEIRADPALSDLPVVILTASTVDADRAAAFKLHTAGYFMKSAIAPRYQDVINFLYAYWSRSEFCPTRPAT